MSDDQGPTPHWCPVEGCGFGVDDERTLQGVRSHIQNTVEDAHDWGVLGDEVEAQADDHPDYQGASTEGEGTDEGGDPAETTPDDPQNPPRDPDDDPEDTDMATETEYEAQHDTDEPTNSDGDNEGGPTPADEGFSLPVPRLSTTQLALLVGLCVVVTLVYLKTRDSGADEQGSETPDTPEDSTDDELPSGDPSDWEQ